MCPELDTLFVTLNGHILDKKEDLQASLLHQVRLSNFDPQVLGKWASEVVHNFANHKSLQRENTEGVSSEILGLIGLDHSFISRASSTKIGKPIIKNLTSIKRDVCSIGGSLQNGHSYLMKVSPLKIFSQKLRDTNQ